eukprot:CFRG8518T1
MTVTTSVLARTSVRSSTTECCEWEGDCLIGSTYNENAGYDTCSTSKSSSISCESVCCKPSGVPPSPTPNPYLITCEEKNVLNPGSLTCSNIDDDKPCCQWSGDCGSLSKCTNSYCCVSPPPNIECCEWEEDCMPGSEYNENAGYDTCNADTDSSISCQSVCCKPFGVPPSPTPNPYLITCEEKNVLNPGSLTCDNIDDDKKCCQWSGDCGSLSKCTNSYCCCD